MKNLMLAARNSISLGHIDPVERPTDMGYRRDENIYRVTARLRLAHRRDMRRYAVWLALGAGVFLADVAVNGYWKATTGHTMLECFILHPQGCDAPSMKIHGE